ncbi:molecular chaperone [Achromobacter sp. Bel]|uniref:fimbrial biogenesis chaperone n=1 Tax=Achromobacter sp. Bel TaxID=2727415 RepID=UPI00145D3C7E|nr:molecular chaperone [Achromobacter sp. Bel]NMK44849.1 molecular chaperone [Achromobacter sp. Bel]
MNTGNRSLPTGWRIGWSLLFLCLPMATAWADLAVTGTRFVYTEGAKHVVIPLSNTGKAPILVQAWLDHGGAEADLSRLQVPFVLMPTLFRIDPGERKAMQLRYTGEPLPKDRETVLRINLRHTPSTRQSENRLQVVLSYVMKVLYRPKGLPGTPQDAPAQVRWTFHPGTAQDAPYWRAENPTPYSVSLATVRVGGRQGASELKGLTLMPKSVEQFLLPMDTTAPSPAGDKLDFEAVDDLGLVVPGTATLRAASRP